MNDISNEIDLKDLPGTYIGETVGSLIVVQWRTIEYLTAHGDMSLAGAMKALAIIPFPNDETREWAMRNVRAAAVRCRKQRPKRQTR